MITFQSPAVIESAWTLFKANISQKTLSIQYVDDAAYGEGDPTLYTIFAFDGPAVYVAKIWKGAVPADVIAAGYSQATNDADKAEWEAGYKAYANRTILQDDFDDLDSRNIHRFGNLTAASTNEVLLCARGYTEPAAQGQRSVVSTSATDSDAAATGLRQVRITYLDSSYVKKTEDVLTAGLTPVNTVATDIRFVESMNGTKGTDAVGAVKLMTLAAGGGTEICGIGAATQDAFLCHHYVPAGQRAWLLGWGLTVSDDVNGKVKGQARFGANLVDTVVDLDNLAGLTAATRTSFYRNFKGLPLGEKTYVRLTVVPGQNTSTVIRGMLDLWEDKA